MKHYLLTFGLMLSLLIMGGCSKDDEPGSGNGKTSGKFEIDGIKANVKYGYLAYDGDDYIDYSFYDTDVMKYLNKDVDDVDKEFTSIFVSYDVKQDKVVDVEFDYKINFYRETGIFYASEWDVSNVSYSDNGSKVKIGSEALRMEGEDFETGKSLGWFTGSFSVEGNPKDVTDILDDYDYSAYSRGIEIVEVTDPEQVSFLKSLRSKNRKLSRNN